MAIFRKAHRFAAAAPEEALADALGFAGLCLLIFAGFMAPAFF